jgi:hypothetical protein
MSGRLSVPFTAKFSGRVQVSAPAGATDADIKILAEEAVLDATERSIRERFGTSSFSVSAAVPGRGLWRPYRVHRGGKF